MSSARDHDDWRIARRSRERADDPMPPGGLAEHTHCATKARTGQWSADFLHVVNVSYRGQIPPRFERRVEAIRAELLAWRRRRAMLDALPAVRWITILFPNGATVSTTELDT